MRLVESGETPASNSIISSRIFFWVLKYLSFQYIINMHACSSFGKEESIVGYSSTNVNVQQTTNQRLAEKCTFFCMTAFTRNEYFNVIGLATNVQQIMCIFVVGAPFPSPSLCVAAQARI